MTKLTRDMWISAGLEALRDRGFVALKADLLAKELKVTRGSFYGYFESIDAFHDAIFTAWLAQSQRVAGELSQEPSPREKLAYLVKSAANADLALERAIRAWAQAAPAIRHRVEEIDTFRVSALTAVFAEMGADASDAARRAKLLYATAIGAAYLPGPASQVGAAEVAFLVDAFHS